MNEERLEELNGKLRKTGRLLNMVIIMNVATLILSVFSLIWGGKYG